MSYNCILRIILLIISVISIHICPSKCNVIPDVRPIESEMVGTVVVDNSSPMHTNIDNEMNKRTDNKAIKQKITDQYKQMIQPVDVSLYGFASMIDPRALTHQSSIHRPKHIRPPQPQQIPEYQYNSYQQMLENMKMSETLNQYGIPPMPFQPNSDEEALHVLKNYLKKYDMKKYVLKKILGDAYENEEGHDEGFFANNHLRRHGGAGMAAKVFGELIGIKIRKTIENFGDTISDYAKELTTNGFVTIGNTFTKLFRLA